MSGKQLILSVDLVGGLVVATGLIGGAWLMIGPVRAAGAEAQQIETEMTSLGNDADSLRDVLFRQQALADQLRQTLESHGTLPGGTPIEQDLDSIANMARANGLVLAEVTPLGTVEYPGIRERKYRLLGSGRFQNWVSFMHAFEGCDIWADITYVTIERTQRNGRRGDDEPTVNLTISFFSTTQESSDDAGP